MWALIQFLVLTSGKRVAYVSVSLRISNGDCIGCRWSKYHLRANPILEYFVGVER